MFKDTFVGELCDIGTTVYFGDLVPATSYKEVMKKIEHSVVTITSSLSIRILPTGTHTQTSLQFRAKIFLDDKSDGNTYQLKMSPFPIQAKKYRLFFTLTNAKGERINLKDRIKNDKRSFSDESDSTQEVHLFDSDVLEEGECSSNKTLPHDNKRQRTKSSEGSAKENITPFNSPSSIRQSLFGKSSNSSTPTQTASTDADQAPLAPPLTRNNSFSMNLVTNR